MRCWGRSTQVRQKETKECQDFKAELYRELGLITRCRDFPLRHKWFQIKVGQIACVLKPTPRIPDLTANNEGSCSGAQLLGSENKESEGGEWVPAKSPLTQGELGSGSEKGHLFWKNQCKRHYSDPFIGQLLMLSSGQRENNILCALLTFLSFEKHCPSLSLDL